MLRDEVLKSVDKLNQEIYDKYGDLYDFIINFEVDIVDYFCVVKFNYFSEFINVEITLWNSEDDSRPYDEKTDQYEDFYTFFKRRLKEVTNELYGINF